MVSASKTTNTAHKPTIYWIRVHWDDGDKRTIVHLGAHTYTEFEPTHAGEWTFMTRQHINQSSSRGLINSISQALPRELPREQKYHLYQQINPTSLKIKY